MERNKLKRAWIWLWYNNVTRLLFVLVPSYLVLLIPALLHAGASGYTLKFAIAASYSLVSLWAMLDNDYTNLERIGLDVNRRPLPKAP